MFASAVVVLVGTAEAPHETETELGLGIASERDVVAGEGLMLDSSAWSCSSKALLEMRDGCQARTAEKREDQSVLTETTTMGILLERLACCLHRRISCLE